MRYFIFAKYGESDDNNIFHPWGAKGWVWGFEKGHFFKKLCDDRALELRHTACHGTDWINKTIKKKRIRQGSVISLYTEAPSTRIRIFLKTHLFLSVFKEICVHTRSVFENIPVHTKTLLHSNFAVRTSAKENRQSKCPFVVPKDPCACSDTSQIDALTSAFSKSSVFTRPHDNVKTAFSKRSTLESVFEKLRFR